MSDQFTLKLNSHITEEQWDAITDVDFDNTEEIFFHTKHGKEVTFVKQKKGKWNKVQRTIRPWKAFRCSECKHMNEFLADFCPNCGADMRGEKDAE